MILITSLSLIAAAPIPGCVPDPLDPLADSDEDGEYDSDEELIGSNPCDPCEPNPNCNACLRQLDQTPIPTPTPKLTPTATPKLTPKLKPTLTPTPSLTKEKCDKYCRGKYGQGSYGKIIDGKCKCGCKTGYGFYSFNEKTVRCVEIKMKGLLEGKTVSGKCSWFGGKDDLGIDKKLRQEYHYKFAPIGVSYEDFFKSKKRKEEFNKWMDERREFFGGWKEANWEGTALGFGPARELDTENKYFCAMRWPLPYPKEGLGSKVWLRNQKIKVTYKGKSVIVQPVDWGPNQTTGRIIDLSYRAKEDIGAITDRGEVEIAFATPNTKLGPVMMPKPTLTQRLTPTPTLSWMPIPRPTPTPKRGITDIFTPGFEAVSAIAGLLAIAYLLRRRR